jgi:hypothetical protein
MKAITVSGFLAGMIDEEYGAAKAALEIIRAKAHRDSGVKW